MSDEILGGLTGSTTSGTDELNTVLQNLHRACPDVQLSIVATDDGLTMTSFGEGSDPDGFSASGAELRTICQKLARRLHQGDLQQMLVRCSEGYVLVAAAGQNAFLAVMTQPDCNLGLIFIETEVASASVKGIVG